MTEGRFVLSDTLSGGWEIVFVYIFLHITRFQQCLGSSNFLRILLCKETDYFIKM